ncbi:Outer membrane autotransporter barrel [Pseudomonas synxantha]|uniref:Outer membrane autotransporter barrel n=1 Tax=Pseudomonas synxantha TaxID=47883 RepID=A0A3G7U8A5_9PSED|nr:autotransporter outer membrane beta-barrel domain-containing protein [Pseudomonas synxantha]AZE55550.1 Outer membrane autotransporter barrel [Pseudomonas synxantha]
MRTRITSLLFSGIASAIVLAAWPLASYGACTINNTAGSDASSCDSATAPGFSDNSGDNTLEITATGRVSGNVVYGGGNDLVDVNGPSAGIDGSLDQGDGNNIFRLNLGSITGSVRQGSGADIAQISGGQAGDIIQGSGIDHFAMSGGTIDSLEQGDALDVFAMSGGRIIDAFDDGDRAVMTGGRIGRVNMKLDDNFFDMSGGVIDRNLVTGFGRDTILVSGLAVIGGNISVSGGNDQVVISGGTVHGQLLLSFGNDDLIWSGGNLHSSVLMGEGDDTALLQGLVAAQVAAAQLLDGGLGIDTLTLDNTKVGDPALFTQWENIRLDNGSQMTLGGTLKLGDSATGTGALSIDGSSALLVGTGSIDPFTAGRLVNVTNSGTLDMTTGSSTASDTLTINGNYTGDGGRMALQTVLGADDSASDKLVVSSGTLQGNTHLLVTNLGGAGAATLQDGIQVVQALNGASGTGTAFILGNTVSAGAFDYYLFKGGVTAGTAQNYYLRSTIPLTPLPEPEGPVTPLPEPVAQTPPLPPNPTDKEIPIYRPEASLYASQFPAAQQIVRGMLGTYHERMGDQSRQQQTGTLPAGWGRVYGNSSRQSFTGTVSPNLDGSLTGFQAGTDVFAGSLDNGLLQRLGFFVGHSRLKGNVKGFNGGWEDKDAGKTTLRGDSVGAYWTLIGAYQAYLDLVLMGTRFDGNSESDRGVKMKTRGHNVTASAEVGWPFMLTATWRIEPQAQLVFSKTKLDSQNDGISEVSYDADTNVTTRLGVRLRGDYLVNGMPLQPYVRANVWHASAGDNSVFFNHETRIDTEQKSTTVDVRLGASLKMAQGVILYGEVGTEKNLDSNMLRGRQGTLGLRIEF